MVCVYSVDDCVGVCGCGYNSRVFMKMVDSFSGTRSYMTPLGPEVIWANR